MSCAPPAGERSAGPGPDERAVWHALDEVPDPEIPAVSVVELGMVREVRLEPGTVVVALAPTFAGCPAFDAIAAAVQARVAALGVPAVRVERVLSPPWTSDAISDAGRRKLRAFGLAPPGRHHGLLELELEAPVACPRCGSFDTEQTSAFGSTLCRAIHRCRACGEAFERLKPL